MSIFTGKRSGWWRPHQHAPPPVEVFRSLENYLDPDCDHDTWFRILAGCRSADDSEAMREACRIWSMRGSSYDERSFAATWRSIRPDGGIGFGTVVKMARDAGWPGIGKSPSKALSRPVEPRLKPKADQPSPEEKERVYGWTPPGNPVAIYYYNRPNGDPIYRKIRYKTPDGKITPFQCYDPIRDAWVGGPGCMEGVERVLYRNEHLPRFQRVFIVEGEKGADALWSRELLATCSDSGAEHWRPEFSAELRGKDIVILPDNDAPGHRHAELSRVSKVFAQCRLQPEVL